MMLYGNGRVATRTSFNINGRRESIDLKVEALPNVDVMISNAIAENAIILREMLSKRLNMFAICLIVYSTAGYSRMVNRGAYALLATGSDRIDRIAKSIGNEYDALFSEDEIARKMNSKVRADVKDCIKNYIKNETQNQLRKLYR